MTTCHFIRNYKSLTYLLILLFAFGGPFEFLALADSNKQNCSIYIDAADNHNFYLKYVSTSNDHGWWRVDPPSEMTDGIYEFQFTWYANFAGTQGMNATITYSARRESDDQGGGTLTFHVNCTMWADHANYIGQKATSCSSTFNDLDCSVWTNNNSLEFKIQNS